MSEKVKHIADAVVASCGGAAVLSHWVSEVLNPILTSAVSVVTIVWLFYRIQEIRHNKKKGPG